MNRVPLSQVCNYSDDSVRICELDLNNFISTDNMLPNRGGITEAVNLPPANSCSAFSENEILISNIRPYFKKIWFAEFGGGCSADVLVLKTVNSKFDPKFVYYNLFQDLFFKHQMTGSKGSKMPRGDKDQIMTFLIPEFDKTYQKRVSEFLTVIDEKIALNKKINTELENLAKAIYNYWFLQFDFPNEEGTPYKTSGGEMEWNGELKREIPKGWKKGKLCEVANIIMGQSPEGSSYNEDGEGIVFYQGSTDFNFRFPEVRMFTTEPTRFAKEGDILLSVRAPVGTINVANEDCCIGRGLAALNSKNETQSYLLYLMFYFKSMFDIQNRTGTTFGSIDKETLYDLSFPKPPTELQTRFQEIVGKYDAMILSKNRENQELIKLRDFLLPLLMNGQVIVKSEAKEQLSMAAEPQVKYGK
ncbi:MAG: restriction endonuclease subunit S [Cyclobacteriaceae bacterium]